MSKKKKQHIHFIGIAGSIIAPLAVAMKQKGWHVTGSDQAFYPPASTYLIDNKIKIIPGYSADKFKKIGVPDVAMMMSFLTPKNPEVIYLKRKNVEIISLGQLLERFFISKNSIVVTGNYGKTTITSLIAWILETAGMDPTLLGGGYINNFNGGVKIGKSDWTVSEGDEFKNWNISRNYRFTKKSRIHFQKPKYVVFTDATWDHYDQYQTKEEYLNNFIKFIKLVPKDGFVVGNGHGKNVRQVLSYAKSDTALVHLKEQEINYTKTGSEFIVSGKKYKTNMLGRIGVLNAALAITLARAIGVNDASINKALRTYKGVKRRQEVRYQDKSMMIIDDFAHSPVKLRGLIDALRLHFPKDKIILLYQPGSKDKEALKAYAAKTFTGVDYIVLPRVSSVAQESRHFNALLTSKLKKTKIKSKVSYVDDDDKAVDLVLKKINAYKKSKKHVIVLFAAQRGFRGMIEELTRIVKKAA